VIFRALIALCFFKISSVNYNIQVKSGSSHLESIL